MLRCPMSDARYQRIKQLMLAARELSPSERAEYLAGACGGDEDLRREVESLLEHDAGAPSFLDPRDPDSAGHRVAPGESARSQPPAGDASAAEVEPPGDLGRLGPYRLLRLLGEGGMGRVFLAEQTSPIRREVAVKVIRRGLDTDRVVARFESERQALAVMNHPGIARVFDAGADEHGRPYFVMEHVLGEAITVYCERHRLKTRARLELFLDVCAAVQHAHQRGLIHRDLKPSNVLVGEQDGRVVPKIIDFGIAKAIETAPGTESLTMQGQMVGTPDYMSPEQAGAVAGGVDTRTDVYSLGVILYELLTGGRPVRFDDATPAEVTRRIAQAEPARPSTAIAGAMRERSAAHRTTQLRRELAGDLDMIVLTALRKEPARRYASVEALGTDIERHLAGRPVSARPDTWTYRSAKFVRRNRAAVAAGAVALVLIAVLVTAYTVRLRAQRDLANGARDEAEAVTAFLAGMLESPDPSQLGRNVTVESVLERAAGQVEREMATRPRVAAQLDEAIGRAYYGLGDPERSGRHLRRSLAARERLLGPGAPATMNVRAGLWRTLTEAERFAEAESLARVNLAIQRKRYRDEEAGSLLALNAIAKLAWHQGRWAEAESLYRYVIAARERVTPQDTLPRLDTTGLLAHLLAEQARFAAAESLYLPLIRDYRRMLGPEDPSTINMTGALGVLYLDTSRYAAAESVLADVVATRRRVQGTRHPSTVRETYNLAVVYLDVGRYAEAEPLFLDVIVQHRRVYGDNSVNALIAKNRLARLYANSGRLARAESLMRVTLAGRRVALGPEHVGTLGTQVWLAIVLGRQGRTAEADDLFARTLAIQRRVLGPRHTNTLNTAFSAGEFHLDAGRPARAAPLLEEATLGVGEEFGEDHPDWVRYATRWGECLTRLGRFAAADSLLRRAWKQWDTAQPSLVASPAATARTLAALYDAWGKPAEARAWRERAATVPAGPHEAVATR